MVPSMALSSALWELVLAVCARVQGGERKDADQPVHDALEALGRGLSARRAFIQLFGSFGDAGMTFEWRANGAEVEVLPDAASEPRWRDKLDRGELIIESGPECDLIMAPMRRESKCVGVLGLEGQLPERGDEVLRVLAASVSGVFFHRAGLQKFEQRTFEVSTLDRLFDAVDRSGTVAELLEAATRIAADAFGCDGAGIVESFEDRLLVTFGLGLEQERLQRIKELGPEARDRLMLRWQRFAVSTFTASLEQPSFSTASLDFGSEVWVSLRGLGPGPAWLLVRQSSFGREWSVDERWLLAEYGRRLSEAVAHLRSYEELQERQDQYREVLRAIPEIVFVFDAEGHLAEVCSDTDNHTHGLSARHIGRPVHELFGASTASLIEATVKHACSSDEVQQVEYVVEEGGQPRTYAAQVRQFGTSTKPRVLWVGRDVTEQRELETRFLQSQRLESVGRLAGGVAHDFNNLLTAIMGSVDLARTQIESGSMADQDLEHVGEAAERGARLANQLLTFARKDAAEPELVAVDQTLLHLDRMLRRLLGENIEFVTVPGSRDASVLIDPSQFEQVVMNLVLNARDSMPLGGTIHVETGRIDITPDSTLRFQGLAPGPYLQLRVSDTGVGIPSENVGRVFDPFFTTKPAGEGTGLGLSTTYGIVRQNRGHIDIEKTSSRGTVFRVLFPRLQGQPVETIAPEEREIRGDETILFVEDESIVRDVTRRYLEQLGYSVLEARNGSEAIRLASSYDGLIHLLLTDVVMPKMSGTQLTGLLLESRPDIKVLYISGYTEEAGLLSTRNPRMHFFAKPFAPQALAARIRTILDDRAAERASVNDS